MKFVFCFSFYLFLSCGELQPKKKLEQTTLSDTLKCCSTELFNDCNTCQQVFDSACFVKSFSIAIDSLKCVINCAEKHLRGSGQEETMCFFNLLHNAIEQEDKYFLVEDYLIGRFSKRGDFVDYIEENLKKFFSVQTFSQKSLNEIDKYMKVLLICSTLKMDPRYVAYFNNFKQIDNELKKKCNERINFIDFYERGGTMCLEEITKKDTLWIGDFLLKDIKKIEHPKLKRLYLLSVMAEFKMHSRVDSFNILRGRIRAIIRNNQ